MGLYFVVCDVPHDVPLPQEMTSSSMVGEADTIVAGTVGEAR